MRLFNKNSGKSPDAGALLRDLAVNVLTYAESREERSFIVTGLSSGCGKTTVALGLAEAMTAFGKRVLLVESSPGRSVLAGKLGLGKGRGISEYLSGSGKPLSGLIEEHKKNFFILTDGREQDQLFSLKKTEELYDKCKSDFDIVLLDSINISSQAFHLPSSIKSLILVVNGESDSSGLLASSLASIEDRGAIVAGLVLNRHRQYIPDCLMRLLRLN